MDGIGGPVVGEWVQFVRDLSGKSHKNTDTIPAHNHVYIGCNAGGLILDNIQVAIPEPATLGLLAVGGVGALMRRRRG